MAEVGKDCKGPMSRRLLYWRKRARQVGDPERISFPSRMKQNKIKRILVELERQRKRPR